MSDRERCKEQVWGAGDWRGHQCSRYAVKDGYCKQHHPDAVAERRRKSNEAAERAWQNSPHKKLERAKKKIDEQQAEIEELRAEIARLKDGK